MSPSFYARGTAITQAGLADLDDLAKLFDGYRQFYGQPSDPQGARAFLRTRIENGDSIIYLARADETAVGFVQLYPSFSSVSMQRIWILNDLYVAPEARSTGTGRALMERARELAVTTGAKGLFLATATDNVTAQKLYERLGYERDTDFYHYFLGTTKH